MASAETGTEQACWRQRWGENEVSKQQKKDWLCHVSVAVANRDAVEMDRPLQKGGSAISLDWGNSSRCRLLCHPGKKNSGMLCILVLPTRCSVHPLSSSARQVYPASIIISWQGKIWISAQALALPIWSSRTSSSSLKDARRIFALCPLKTKHLVTPTRAS